MDNWPKIVILAGIIYGLMFDPVIGVSGGVSMAMADSIDFTLPKVRS